jgi:hypothetical protein
MIIFGRLQKLRLISLSVLLLLAACRVPFADPYPRPVGIGRTADGQFRFVVPLCDGETFSAFEVVDHQTERPVWSVSQPIQQETKRGIVVLGEAKGFAKQEVPLKLPLPSNISVSVRVSNGSPIGQGFLLDDVPEGVSGTGEVLNFDDKRVTEKEFQEQVTAEYC